MDTPLLNALLEHIRLRTAPFHMPGHKGRMEAFEDLASTAALDVTELPDTGDLYAGDDVIAQAQELWAGAWGFHHCQFLTCGSTQGLHAALLLAAQRPGVMLVDRCSHKSVYNALGLLDRKPVYLMRRQDQAVSPALLEEGFAAMAAAGETVSTVCVTSPTYYGVLSDIPALAKVAHGHGALLVVDAAHGCHLPFLGANPFLGVDLVVSSAHKTLSVYGQGALLFSGGAYSPRDLRWAAGVCGTSSPSYPIMASMDWARAQMEGPEGARELQELAGTVAELREEFSAMDGPGLDPLRLTLTLDAIAADGYQVKEYLEGMGVFPEMADRDHVVFLLSPANTAQDLDRLRRGLEEVRRAWPGVFGAPMAPLDPPEPDVVLSPARALTAPRLLRPLSQCEGLVCLQQVAPYPPGVPVIAQGERVTKKGLAYLREVGYNIQEEVYMLDQSKWEEARL